MNPRSLPLTVLSLAIGFGSLAEAPAATATWQNSASSTAWSLAGNWGGTAPVSGDDLVFTNLNGTVANQPSNNDLSNLNLRSITFTNTTFNAPLTLGGNAITLDGALGATATLVNNNTTASRDVTIGNSITVSGAQTWSLSSTSANAVTILSGNLSGTGAITLNATGSRNTTLPALRLTGSNSGYTGTITVSTTTQAGLLLGSANAMTGGLIVIDNNDKNLWLTGGVGSGTYTFGLTNAASSSGTTTGARVALRPTADNNGNGIYLTGGDVVWNPVPSVGNDYLWTQSGSPVITINGSDSTTPRMLTFGATGRNLVLSHTAAGQTWTIMGSTNQTGNNPGRVNMLFALKDDLTGGRNFLNRAELLILNAAAVNQGATNSITSVGAGGAMSVSNMNQIFSGQLRLDGGVMLLNNLSWSSFTAGRTAGYVQADTANSNSWRIGGAGGTSGGGFAARGTNVTISGGTGVGASTFDRNFTLGSNALDSDGTFYANAGIEVAVNTTLTGTRTISVAPTGPGLTSQTNGTAVHVISGNLGGTGSLAFASTVFNAAQNAANPGQVRLSGTNSWTGSAFAQTFNSGAGGLVGQRVLVEFNSAAALPSGTGGATSYLASFDENNAAQGGFLLRGGATIETYSAATNQAFVLGGSGSTTTSTPNSLTLGSSAGLVRLQGTSVFVNQGVLGAAGNNVQLGGLSLYAATGSTFTLGNSSSGAGRVNFAPSFGRDAASTGTATTLGDATFATKTLTKRGEGTVVLDNVTYTLVNGTGSTASQFVWQIGRGTANAGSTSYFDGALRETGTASSNSLTGFNIRFGGGVLESNNTTSGGGFTRALGTGATQVQWLSNGGGGFAAFGGAYTVNIGSGAALTWGTGSFVLGSGPLLLGSGTADNVVTFQNAVSLNGAQREIRVIDNASSSADRAVISGVLSGTGSSGVNKTGTGTLELASGTTHNYVGATTVTAGTLLVNGGISGTGAVSVLTGATLGGSGTIGGATTINSGAILSPGNSPGLLTFSNSLSLAGTTLMEIDGVNRGLTLNGYDAINVGTSLTYGGTLSLTFGFTPVLGAVFDLFNFTSQSGTFSAINFVNSGYAGTFNYTTGELTVTAVPEPGTWALMALGLTTLVVLRRRRQS